MSHLWVMRQQGGGLCIKFNGSGVVLVEDMLVEVPKVVEYFWANV